MTDTSTRLDLSTTKNSLARQINFTQIMCAGEGVGASKEREFDESKVKRAGGKFATRAEKAEMAEKALGERIATYKEAEPGLVEFSDGTKTYKLTDDQSKRALSAAAEMTAAVAKGLTTAATDPKAAAEIAMAAANKLTKDVMAIADEVKTGKPEAKKVLVEQAAPAKAQSAAQVTKAIANNMSDDQVKKGLVAVTKQLNSGKPSKPEQVMEMIEGWAAEAQKNIDSGIKAIKSAGSEAKAKALAAGTGLMTKIAEMAAAAQNSAAGKAIGNAYNVATKAISDKAVEIGFSPNLRDLPGDLGQVGKDLMQDAKETAEKIKQTVTSPNFAANLVASTGVVALRLADDAARKKAGLKPKPFIRQVVEGVVVSRGAHNLANKLVPPTDSSKITGTTAPALASTEKPKQLATIPKPAKFKIGAETADKAFDLAEVAVKSAVGIGLPASVGGAVIGGVLGGLAGGPPGFITGLQIGRDVGGIAGTMKGIQSEYENRSKDPNRKDSQLVNTAKLRQAGKDLGKTVDYFVDKAPEVIDKASQALAETKRKAVETAENIAVAAKIGAKNAAFFADGVQKGAARLDRDLAPVKKAAGEAVELVKTTYANRQIDTSEPGIRGVQRSVDRYFADPVKSTENTLLDGKRKAVEIRRDLDARVAKAKNDAEDIAIQIEQAKINSRAASRNFNAEVEANTIGRASKAANDIADTARNIGFDIVQTKDKLGLGVNLLGRSLSQKRLEVQKASQQQAAERKRSIDKAKRAVVNSPLGDLARAADAERAKIQRKLSGQSLL